MTENLEKTIACFKALGLTPKVDNFKDKLVMQKTVYLLEKMGLDLGFSYGLYVRGPYSPALTKQLYAHKEQVERLTSSTPLTEPELSTLEELKTVFDLGNAALLEIAATYEYFTDSGLTEDNSVIRVKELKPFYSETDVAVGVSKAKKLFFKPTEKDLTELKKELAPWQTASLETLKTER